MGSLSSRPKIPSQTQTATPAVSPVAAAPVAPVTTTPEGDAQETAAKARRQGLLNRDRGVFGTVETTLRGLLGENENARQRKTLLGE